MNEKVLVVEDESDIRELLEIHLLNEGYEVFTAKDGEEALKIFNIEKIDIALLDVMMPKVNGFKVIKHIREVSNIPIIFITARVEDEDKILGLGLGADDYISKPFSPSEVIARVQAHLRRYLAYSNKIKEELICGNLTIDKKSCEVKKDGEVIQLNAKEYKLLLLFMENMGRVFTKKQLYENVWEDDYYGDSNTIMVHISHLRDKIEVNPKNPSYLKTVRGIGYKMEKK
ncbi:response regulator transcription factor [Oceanirhabdus sp. W0125-5]|uniref:response regulator transcription factor n=1 Tax=Oceanirhabdus sp. W0125-5 TaxID=2999116 RepID=UPI0022F33A76|nr:response regulator transcription factor [Oceanirhabdus sp. W0125-5]WBW97628.1 response regulator transcription factor [Oceanirhabdus sp. W0125-5]